MKGEKDLLKLKQISKRYQTGDFIQTALDKVSLNFRKNEFVSILGPSGSGKTTLLNIIGGLDRYDEGDVIIDGQSTKKFTDRDWDTYRNHSVGFVFQSYNLIAHQSVLSNVELALKIGGQSRDEQKEKAVRALEEVGLGDHLHKRPNQLSGGQMQRVAIARALVNDPEILLADEPTGALDSETSTQIMELLKEVAKERLVIMVTHDSELAEDYSTRIVQLRDGEIVGDSHRYEMTGQSDGQTDLTKRSASMSFLTSLKLSFNNLMDKKGRTLLTAFAGSIGIIGIGLVLGISNGVNDYIAHIQEDTLANYPLVINDEEINLTSFIEETVSSAEEEEKDISEVKNKNSLPINMMPLQAQSEFETNLSENDLKSFKTYLEKPESKISGYLGQMGVSYNYDAHFTAFTEDANQQLINPDEIEDDNKQMGITLNMQGFNEKTQPEIFMSLNEGTDDLVNQATQNQYELLAGEWPQSGEDLMLITNPDGQLFPDQLVKIGLITKDEQKDYENKIENGEKLAVDIPYENILGKTFAIVPESARYKKLENNIFQREEEPIEKKADIPESIEAKITGIIMPKEENDMNAMRSLIGYTQALNQKIAEFTRESPVVQAQVENPDKNVITGMPFDAENDQDKMNQVKTYLKKLPDILKGFIYLEHIAEEPENSEQTESDQSDTDSPMAAMALAPVLDAWLEQDPDRDILLKLYDRYLDDYSYEDNLKQFGVINEENPSQINLYVDTFEDKDHLKAEIDKYNDNVSEEKEIIYNDYVGMLTDSITSIINVISYVLIAFISVSLLVSAIMIGIITYISVQERTKEIGILRALGASKGNTAQMFIAENILIGLTSGLVGIGISQLGLTAINYVVQNPLGYENIATSLGWKPSMILILLCTAITVLGGLYPSMQAAKKDPVEALRSE